MSAGRDITVFCVPGQKKTGRVAKNRTGQKSRPTRSLRRPVRIPVAGWGGFFLAEARRRAPNQTFLAIYRLTVALFSPSGSLFAPVLKDHFQSHRVASLRLLEGMELPAGLLPETSSRQSRLILSV